MRRSLLLLIALVSTSAGTHVSLCECVPPSHCPDELRFNSSVCEDGKVCCGAIPDTSHEETLDGEGAQCRRATTGESPWSVAIYRISERKLQPRGSTKNSSNVEFVCAGTLIHLDIVLTAAHCVQRYAGPRIDLLRVSVGSRSWQGSAGKVKIVRVHPEFQPTLLHHDLALIMLTASAELGNTVRTACLPSPSQLQLSDCLFTGWGNLPTGPVREQKWQPLNESRSVHVNMTSHENCERILQENLESYFRLHPKISCGQSKSVAIKGDGGAPLMCAAPGQPDQLVLVGVASWSYPLSELTVFMNVAENLQWIEKELNLLVFDIAALQL